MRLSELVELPEHHHCQAIAAQPADASHGQQESLHHHLTGAEIFTPYSAGSVSVARGVTRTQILLPVLGELSLFLDMNRSRFK